MAQCGCTVRLFHYCISPQLLQVKFYNLTVSIHTKSYISCVRVCVSVPLCVLEMCYLPRSCFNKVLGQLQGCQSILNGIMTLLLFSLYFPPGIQVENLITVLPMVGESHREWIERGERETTYFSTVSARTLSLNLCPNSFLYSSEVSITCWWISCREDTNTIQVKTSTFNLKMIAAKKLLYN